jgi:hypothetical protein
MKNGTGDEVEMTERRDEPEQSGDSEWKKPKARGKSPERPKKVHQPGRGVPGAPDGSAKAFDAAVAAERFVDESRGPDAAVNRKIDMTYAEAMKRLAEGTLWPEGAGKKRSILTEKGLIPPPVPTPPALARVHDRAVLEELERQQRKE